MSVLASIGASSSQPRAGTWRLQPGQAVTLRPSQSGVLWVVAGGLWATGDGPHPGPGNARGDRVLAAGETVSLRAGERLVVEAVGPAAAAQFGWDPLPPWAARRHSLSAVLWRLALLVPATALTAAMWLGAASESSRHRADVAQAPRAMPGERVSAQTAQPETAAAQLRQPPRGKAPA
jgi:hypothetical protein